MKTSEKIDQIAVALCKAQASMEGAKKTSTNPFFHSKYADLAEVWETCREPLTANGLSFVQSIGCEPVSFTAVIPGNKDGKTPDRECLFVWLTVTSRLLHTSEQWIEDSVSMPVEADPQAIGKMTTYIRRYAQMALCGIAPEDDDGEGAAGRGTPQLRPHPKTIQEQPPAQANIISDAQRKRLYTIAKGQRWEDAAIKAILSAAPYCLESTAQIKRADYDTICAIFSAPPPSPVGVKAELNAARRTDPDPVDTPIPATAAEMKCPETHAAIDVAKCTQCPKFANCVPE